MDKNTKDILEAVNFIKDRMLTKDEGVTKADLAAVEKKLSDRIDGLQVKVEGIQNTLDNEAMARQDQKLPARVARIEKHLGIDKQLAA